ncbi:MAG: phage terminase large subunit [Alphaproteobacteria bacterium]|nr:phage terminase large subunit [Alphaproteobacteria bacterium]MCW5742213.1 phage terminase large subunit [Alphaproteobacteria bacterium]
MAVAKSKKKPIPPPPDPATMIGFREFFLEYQEIQRRNQPDEILPTPEFHELICVWLEDTQTCPRRLLQAFREASKSYIVCIYIAWRLYRDPYFTAITISSVHSLAEKNAHFIRTCIETHPRCAYLVPQGERGNTWQTTKFNVNRDGGPNEYSVMALSLDGKITGNHAKLVVADDLEVPQSVATPKDQQKLRDCLRELRAISRMRLFVGTPHTSVQKSMYTPLLADPEVERHLVPVYTEDENEARVYAWPDRYDDDEIASIIKESGQAYFESQYMLIPANMTTQGMALSQIVEYETELTHAEIGAFAQRVYKLGDAQITDIEIAWDPSEGFSGKDDSVVSLVLRDAKDNVHLHRQVKLPAVDKDGFVPQFAVVLDLMKQFRLGRITIETNVFRQLHTDFKNYAVSKGYAVQAIPEHTVKDKAMRIELALAHLIASRRFHVHKSIPQAFLDQAANFPACVKNRRDLDDHLDSAALAIARLRPLGARAGSNLERLGWNRGPITSPARSYTSQFDAPRSSMW